MIDHGKILVDRNGIEWQISCSVCYHDDRRVILNSKALRTMHVICAEALERNLKLGHYKLKPSHNTRR